MTDVKFPHWNHRLVRDKDGLHLAEVYYGEGGKFGYVPVGADWWTWVSFLRRPWWLWRALRKPVLRYNEES